MQLPDADLRNILVVRLDNIGDVVMLSPALRAIRQAWPAAHVALLASPAGATVAPLLPAVDEVIVHRAIWQDVAGTLPFDPGAQLRFVDELRRRRFDAALIFTSFSQSPYGPAYAAYLAGIPVRAGESREFGGALLSHAVPPLDPAAHQVDRNLHLLRSLGLPAAATRLQLDLPRAASAEADDLLAGLGIRQGEPFIALAPGASCPSRRYAPARFGHVARELRASTRRPVVLLGNEHDAAVAAEVERAAGRGTLVSLVGRTSVPVLAALIARASLLLANDSGPMHVGEAFLRPMVVTFSGTDLESQWRPRHSPAVLLRRPTTCSPCYGFTCPTSLECLDIAPREVVSAALSLLTSHEQASIRTPEVALP